MSLLTPTRQVLGLASWLALTFVAAAIAGIPSINAGAFYTQLVRPDWAPPASVFGPVWTVLYVLLGIAAWLVWREGGFRGARIALGLFLVQLALNALWSWLFFGWRRGALSFLDISLLLVSVLATAIAFWRVRPLAGWALVPYLMWVSYASALNYAIWRLNPGSLA